MMLSFRYPRGYDEFRGTTALAIFLLTLACGSVVHATPANWTITISNPARSGPPGATLLYDGIITNSTGGDLVFDTAKIDFTTTSPATSYVKDFSDSFLATLGVIPTSGYVGPLFFIQWLPSAPIGAFGTGDFALTAEAPADPLSDALSFSAAVSNVPEPATSHLVALAFVTFGAFARLRFRGLAKRGSFS